MQNANNLIRKLRREKNLTQEDVAIHLKISQKAYSDIENGKTTLKHEYISQLAQVFNVTADVFCQVNNCCAKEQKCTNQKLKELLAQNNIPIPKELI